MTDETQSPADPQASPAPEAPATPSASVPVEQVTADKHSLLDEVKAELGSIKEWAAEEWQVVESIFERKKAEVATPVQGS